MAAYSTVPDPNEPNPDVGQSTPVDAALIRTGASWFSSGAIITPGDVDWYCWNALALERYVITTSTAQWLDPNNGSCCTDQLDGETRYSPWVDPMIRLLRNSVPEIDDDDSAAAGPLDSMIDTNEITGNPT